MTNDRDWRGTTSLPLALRLYLAGAAVLGVSAAAGGTALVTDPTGSTLGLPLAWLDGSPFPDYLVPGIVLLTVFGLGSLVVVYGIVYQRRWAWPAAVGLGVAQVGWILVQLAILQVVHPLHLAYGGLGALLALLALRPSVRAALRSPADTGGE